MLKSFTAVTQIATTNIVEIRYQKTRWVVSKYGELVVDVNKKILAMFNINSETKERTTIFILFRGFICGTERARMNRR